MKRCPTFALSEHLTPHAMSTTHLLRFWLTLLRNPRQIGAIAPAGRSLGTAIAETLLAKGPPGVVIELGAGTGAVTQALLAVREQLHYLVALEKSPELAHGLLKRFPELPVLALCASQLEELTLPQHKRLTLVSSLPFASLPADDCRRLCESIKRISQRYREFQLIQYSYFGKTPFTSPSGNLVWTRGPTILCNLPPATVWTLEKRPSDQGFNSEQLTGPVRCPRSSAPQV